MHSPELRSHRFSDRTPSRARGAADDGTPYATQAEEERVRGDTVPQPGRVWLSVDQRLALVHVRVLFVNDAEWEGMLSYRFTITRNGTSGTAKMRQRDVFSVSPGEETVLASVPISMRAGDRLDLRVVVWAEEGPVSEDRVRHHVPPVRRAGGQLPLCGHRMRVGVGR